MRYTFDYESNDESRLSAALEELSHHIDPELRELITFDKESRKILINLSPSRFKSLKKEIQTMCQSGILGQDALDFTFADETDESKTITRKAIKNLVEEADERLPSYKHDTVAPRISIENLSYESVLERILSSGAKSIIIAEGSHNFIAPAQFVLDNIEHIRNSGAIVVMENFVIETAQEELDSCSSSHQVSQKLRSLVPSMPKSDMHSSVQSKSDVKYKMVESLCKAGIPIVAGDCEASNSLQSWQDRIRLGNYSMIRNTEKYLELHPKKKTAPIIYFTGASHAKGECALQNLTNAITLELHDIYAPRDSSSIEEKKGKIIITRNTRDLTAPALETNTHARHIKKERDNTPPPQSLG